jgi:lysophospholipase L1-like esterase
MMRILIFLFCCLTLVSPAQDNSDCAFIQSQFNHLMFSKDSSSFLRLHQKLDSFEQKKRKQIVVTHIGGSHVQGGIWSNVFCAKLNEELKPSGGGYFIFPYKMAKTNSPPYGTSFSTGKWRKCRCISKDFCLPLGMNGISVASDDSANQFGVALTKRSLIKNFNSIKVYHNFNASFEFDIKLRDSLQAVRIDKLDQGYTQFDIEAPLDSVNFELRKKDTLNKDFVLFGYSLESNLANGIYLAALGVNGASSGSFLRCDRFVEQLRTLSSDLVIISLGVNDTQSKNFTSEEFIEHYDSLIMKIKEASPEVAILLTTTSDNFIKKKTPNKRPVQAKEAMFELMNKHHVAVWDLYSVMGGYKSILKWAKAGLGSADRVHFSPKGYMVVGNLMAEAVLKSYRANIKK